MGLVLLDGLFGVVLQFVAFMLLLHEFVPKIGELHFESVDVVDLLTFLTFIFDFIQLFESGINDFLLLFNVFFLFIFLFFVNYLALQLKLMVILLA